MNLLARTVVHFAWILRLREVLRRGHRRRLLWLELLAVVEALFEALAIGSIVPVVALLADPTAVESNQTVMRIAEAADLSSREDLLLAAGVSLGVLFTLRSLIRGFSQQLRTRLGEQIRDDLAQRLLAGFLNRPYEFHLGASSSRLMTMVTSDSAAVSGLAVQAIAVFSAAATVLMVVGAMLMIDAGVTLVALVVVGAVAVATYWVQHRPIGVLGRRLRRTGQNLTHHSAQALGSIRETRIMGTGNQQLEAFCRGSAAMVEMRTRAVLIQNLPGLIVEWLIFVGISAALVVMAKEPDLAKTVMPTLAAFFFAALRVMPRAMAAVGQASRAHFTRPSLDSVHALLVEDPAAQPAPDHGEELPFHREIAVRNVSVRYRTTAVPALHGATMTIPRGAHVGIVGPSGAGKTTLVNTLLGFLTPASGEITVDGRSIRDGLASWQRRIGFVPQDPFLFDDTIRANITFGRRFPDEAERMARTLAAVRLDEFVAGQPAGLETKVGERGMRISGGQRQRVAIARALYGDPDVVVLDEATSSLDPEIAAAVDDAIAALAGRKTLIIIAHRLVSMSRCDFVVFLSDGRVVATGPLRELRLRNAAFARFSGERPEPCGLAPGEHTAASLTRSPSSNDAAMTLPVDG